MERQENTIGESVVLLPSMVQSAIVQNEGDNTRLIQSGISIKAWDKQKDEKDYWYERFNTYRALGPSRSLRKAFIAQLVKDKGQDYVDYRLTNSEYGLTSAPKTWRNAFNRYHWQDRATAFDAHQHELDMQVETAERDQCRQLRKQALHDLLTASTKALSQIDLSEANLAQASAAIKTAVRELRTEYHDDTQPVEVNAMLAIIPNELRQGILAMLQVKTGGPPALSPADNDNDNEDNIIDNDDTY